MAIQVLSLLRVMIYDFDQSLAQLLAPAYRRCPAEEGVAQGAGPVVSDRLTGAAQ